MNTTKSFFIVAFIGGLINLLIAANLYFSNRMASGFSVGRFGGIQEGSISPTSAAVIGCALILTSIYTFFVYRKEKEEVKKKKEDEEKESRLKLARKKLKDK